MGLVGCLEVDCACSCLKIEESFKLFTYYDGKGSSVQGDREGMSGSVMERFF